MDKQILDAFAAEMLELLQTGSEFIGEQVPVVCQEILRYHMVINIMGLGISVGLWILGKWSFKKLKPHFTNCDDMPPHPHIAAGLCWIVSALFALTSITEIIMILIAPRLYLIAYFMELVE